MSREIVFAKVPQRAEAFSKLLSRSGFCIFADRHDAVEKPRPPARPSLSPRPKPIMSKSPAVQRALRRLGPCGQEACFRVAHRGAAVRDNTRITPQGFASFPATPFKCVLNAYSTRCMLASDRFAKASLRPPVAMPINADKPHLWKADTRASVDQFNRWFMKFAPKAYRDTRKKTIIQVDHGLKQTDDLTSITPEVIKSNPAHFADAADVHLSPAGPGPFGWARQLE